MIVPAPNQYGGYLETILERVYPLLRKHMDGLSLYKITEDNPVASLELTATALQLGVARGTLIMEPGTNKFRLSFEKWVETEAVA